jgi:Uma2 family endonuclease
MGVDLWKAQVEVQKIIGYGSTLLDRQRPLTPRAKQVLKLASEAVKQLGHDEIDTEHILLGLIREKDGVSTAVLKNLGINLQDLEQQVLEQLQQPRREVPSVSTRLGVSRELSEAERPSDFASGEISIRLSTRLQSWIEPRQWGRVVNQTGFTLPNGDIVAPRLAFISRERLKRIPRTYPELVPDLVVEIKSAFDRVSVLQDKIQLFLEQGAKVGLLIDPDEQTVTCDRQGSERIIFKNGETLTLPELLPEWELPVSELWSPVFD